MECSMCSPKSRDSQAPHERGVCDSEESGWTVYFDDFFSPGGNNREYSSGCSSGCGGSSLVSDAASSAAWKIPRHPEKSCKELNFKKRRTRWVLGDEALEDTASSPVNSPKIGNLLGMNHTKKVDNIHSISQEGIGFGKSSEEEAEDRRDYSLVDRENEHAELKKRGLCLVPLSMLANYLR